MAQDCPGLTCGARPELLCLPREWVKPQLECLSVYTVALLAVPRVVPRDGLVATPHLSREVPPGVRLWTGSTVTVTTPYIPYCHFTANCTRISDQTVRQIKQCPSRKLVGGPLLAGDRARRPPPPPGSGPEQIYLCSTPHLDNRDPILIILNSKMLLFAAPSPPFLPDISE